MESFIYVIATGQYYYPILHVLQQPFVIFQLADGECRKLLGALAVCTFRTSYYRVSRRWGFPELGVRQKWWFIMENSVKMIDMIGCISHETSRIFSFILLFDRCLSYGILVNSREKNGSSAWPGQEVHHSISSRFLEWSKAARYSGNSRILWRYLPYIKWRYLPYIWPIF